MREDSGRLLSERDLAAGGSPRRYVAWDARTSRPVLYDPALQRYEGDGPELVDHPDRLLHPLRRTRPKGDPDPGWERISWDEALDLTAAAMKRAAERLSLIHI